MTAKQIRLWVAPTGALVLLAGCATPPPSPAQVYVPIEIGPGGTPPVFFEKVIYRIPTGTRIGHECDLRAQQNHLAIHDRRRSGY